ncbi:hypothetical protein BN14_00713 [Rhizoctonia solani AG-1 IB]|uniref:Uncharacterized protein n=2 Tax=Rhizoctonia solani TaxID=456999 RepID=A0A8H2WXV8_9AGAM|nr:unnamed protein product [Rhizoctonia solani]CCO26682.1 hypothetical protein BN14_00713 [Rhizoctonia solani AG-1 IB]
MIVRNLFFALTFYTLSSWAFEFTFLTIPAQCEELSISINGGTPPYRLLIVPIGPLLSPPEVRTIIDRNITGTTDSFVFNYPAASRFVAMMSDQTGIGTGGTSAIIAVGGTGTKSDCLSPVVTAPGFYLYISPETLTQCSPTNISWGPSPNGQVEGQVSIYNIVIGGQSSSLTIPSGASSISWPTNIRTNTTVMFVAGDSRGPGTGGSSDLYTIGAGSSDCINSSSPSSTQQPPAGGINTAGGTSTATSTPSGSSGGSNNIGAIVGGVVGGVAGIAIILLVLLFFYRRRKHHRNAGTRPMKPDLIDPSEERPQTGDERAGFYEPEPFIMPPPEPDMETSSHHSLYTAHDGGARPSNTGPVPGGHARAPSRLSVTTASELGGVPPSSNGTRKTGMPPPSFRPVNFIQHDDGGEVGDNQDPETIELPPAYTDFRSRAAESSSSGAGASGSNSATTEPPIASSSAAAATTS